MLHNRHLDDDSLLPKGEFDREKISIYSSMAIVLSMVINMKDEQTRENNVGAVITTTTNECSQLSGMDS